MTSLSGKTTSVPPEFGETQPVVTGIKPVVTGIQPVVTGMRKL